MIKLVLLGMMAACAMAQFPMMGLAGFGNLDLKNLGSMIPDGALDMIKNMKPEDIKSAINNMPPEMMQMMQGMGISEDQLKDAVNNMPEDLDVASILDQAKENMGGLLDNNKEEMKKHMEEEMNGMKEEAKKEFEHMGLDMSGGVEGLVSQILPTYTEMLGENLKAEGIDIEDKEQLHEEIRKQMIEFAGAGPDDTDEEIKMKLMKSFLVDMKENGFDINADNTEEGFKELQKQIIAQLKELGFDLGDDLDINNIPAMLEKMMKSGKFNPQQLMQMAAPIMQGPPMMAPPAMHPGMSLNLDININRAPTEVPSVTSSYLHGADDALIQAFGDDEELTRHVMAVKYGAETGTVMEEDLHEILRDLMHYRLEARILMAKNQRLRNRLFDRMY